MSDSLTPDFDTAHAYARAACARMYEHRVPATPANYEVFYAYVSASDRQLVRTMDVLLSNKEPLTQARLDELHGVLAGEALDAGRLAEIGARLSTIAGEAAGQIAEAGRDVGDFAGRVHNVATAAQQDGTQATTLVAELAGEIDQMIQRARTMERALGRSKRTIETLRSDLAEMRNAAETDTLTGLPNRRIMDRALRTAAAAGMETGRPVCVAMIDVDHFKAFNDTHGHLLGDQVLKLVARVLRDNTRARDVVARYGGEEFAVILPDTGLEDAAAVAERIRGALAGRNLTNRQTGEVIGRLTLSGGVATYAYGERLETLIQRADGLLYEAKRAGRNRVRCEGSGAQLGADAA